MDLGKMVDVAIGLSMMFLMLSLFCTILNEVIAGKLLKLRSNTLKSGLAEMAGDCPAFWQVLNHSLIGAAKPDDIHVKDPAQRAAALAAATGTAVTAAPAGPGKSAALGICELLTAPPGPSYIAGRNFASAVLDTINPNVQFSGSATYTAVMEAIRDLPPGRLQDLLRATANTTTQDLQKMRDSIASWFDGEMDRLEGDYRRRLQWVSFLVGVALAVAFNADTLHVAKVLWQDRALAAGIAESAAGFVSSDTGKAVGKLTAAQQAVTDATKALDAAPADQAATLKADLNAKVETQNKQVVAVANDLGALKDALVAIPIGWSADGFRSWAGALYGAPRADGPTFWQAVLQILGWFGTALALTLGAPFWFDTLGKVVNLRSAGSKPATTARLQQAERGGA